MERFDADYLHGTHPEEQNRLSRLNALLNANSLRAMALAGEEKILDVGSGLGQFSRMLARTAGTRGGRVIGVETDPDQLAEARRQAREDGEEGLVEFRQGDAVDLPLAEDEWGTFDIAHARFVLEHVTNPLAVVRSMLRAVRPGGRIVLEDDDHEILRLVPEPPDVLDLWRAYYLTYERQGKDPFVGRNLISLLHRAGARPQGNTCLFFGGTFGSANFDAMIDNFISIIHGARQAMVALGCAGEKQIEDGLAAFDKWRHEPAAAMWYTTAWAAGIRPGGPVARADRPMAREKAPKSTSRPLPLIKEASLLRFLMASAAELNSTLELEEVFHKIATGLQPLIDYHLFAVLLWNEGTQLLEHSFSMKYGEAIPQKGGFPLGYGIGGTSAATRRAIRVDNVLEDPRYVRFRHPEVEIHSELAVPLVFKDQLIGVLDLESTEFGYFTEEHEYVVSTLASHIATGLVNARLFERVSRDERRLDRELATARKTQRRLLPRTVPPVCGLDVGMAYRPALELGGDFYDMLRTPDGRFAVAVGDVAGKATPAALLASMTVGLLRGHLVQRSRGPAEMLAELNEGLQAIGQDNRYVAMVFAVFDDQTRTLRLANAGFPRPLLARADGIRELALEGLPLGMFAGSSYQEQALQPERGDVLVFCSDGLLESENPRGEAFGIPRVREALAGLLTRGAQEIADGLTRVAQDFSGDQARQLDDYTVVVLEFAEAEEPR